MSLISICCEESQTDVIIDSGGCCQPDVASCISCTWIASCSFITLTDKCLCWADVSCYVCQLCVVGIPRPVLYLCALLPKIIKWNDVSTSLPFEHYQCIIRNSAKNLCGKVFVRRTCIIFEYLPFWLICLINLHEMYPGGLYSVDVWIISLICQEIGLNVWIYWTIILQLALRFWLEDFV